MKAGFTQRMLKAIQHADVVLEVLDARFAFATLNKRLDYKLRAKDKKHIYVLNKSDLLSKVARENLRRAFPANSTVFVSSKKKKGVLDLKRKIAAVLHGKGVAGIVGYPNVGKSSLINALAGRKAAPTSITAGFTKGEHFIRLSEDIKLIDSPGVIPRKKQNEFFLALTQSKTPEQLQDPEGAALKLFAYIKKLHPGLLEKKYQFDETLDNDELLTAFAVKKGKLKKGAEPDLIAAAKTFLWEYQKGKFKI